jgi:hypothetical protein
LEYQSTDTFLQGVIMSDKQQEFVKQVKARVLYGQGTIPRHCEEIEEAMNERGPLGEPLHHHPADGKPRGKGFPEPCARCDLEHAAPALLTALKEARQVLETAKQYFPKSIRNRDCFQLLNVLANSVDPTIAKSEGR